MTAEQEAKVVNEIKKEMVKVRNSSIASGMRAALSVVLDMCNKEKSDAEKIEEIKEFCNKGLNR